MQSLSNPSETTTATATVSATTASTPIQPVIQLTASPGSTTTYGQSVSFTATVGPPASGDPTPTGTVQFQIDGSNFGSPVTLDNNGSATSDAISTLTAVGHTITALYSGDPTYAQGSQTLTQTVNPATPTISWAKPTNIVYGAALSTTQLDATASVPGGFAYNPGFGVVLNAGDNQTLSTTFTPTDTTDYTDATANVAINVLQATPTVNVTAPNAAYNGSPYGVLTNSVTGINNANIGAASSFTYYVGMGTGGTDLGSTAPTAAGTYTVVAHYAGMRQLCRGRQRPGDLYHRDGYRPDAQAGSYPPALRRAGDHIGSALRHSPDADDPCPVLQPGTRPGSRRGRAGVSTG